MNPVTKSDLQKEYKANKLELKDSTLADRMMEVAQVLTDTRLMHAQLQKLSDSMLAKYKELWSKTDNDPLPAGKKEALAATQTAMNKANRAEQDLSRHLLSTVLTEFETEMGFKPFQAVNGHPRIIQMTGLLSGPNFQSSVGAGHMAKDYVTVEHGVYSHRIQWYCLGKSERVLKTQDLKGLYVKFQEGLSWLLTFDRRDEHPRAWNGPGLDTFDFRTPEKLHSWLRTPDAKLVCPLVAEYLQAKDKAIKGKSWVVVRKVVAARKLYPAKKQKLDGWKALDNSTLEKKLKEVLTPEEITGLNKFLVKEGDGNVLFPQSDGTYGTTPTTP